MIQSFREIFQRDLERVKIEILSYSKESDLWVIIPGTSNSGGNLCLHLIGNLNAYIGIGLAKTNYVRNRELEFSAKDVQRDTIIEMLSETMLVVRQGLDNVSDTDLPELFPIVVWDKPTTKVFTLMHLSGHLTYHLGQINYHRRMVSANH
ncbi:MAG: DUF1572 domain-containing protein [Chitinophagaceae bacterium]|nr:MAG: DUF1572 domain-containing protein [Chitinophagaceae bacterium]